MIRFRYSAKQIVHSALEQDTFYWTVVGDPSNSFRQAKARTTRPEGIFHFSVKSPEYRQLLISRFFDKYDSVPLGAWLTNAVALLEAKAFEGPKAEFVDRGGGGQTLTIGNQTERITYGYPARVIE